ncbi:hypothetical protein AZE42_13157 [Rhizopogon vesiculosus]|uniref:Uncharacterized protein n=1 Tax=Rhizopogon vesiculosus TaxID=180088 RepID=A0A1J8Q8Y5_9AGAM|nr:hypothetical protein AZE42_13157 [Rhizopogon vesiculosus]
MDRYVFPDDEFAEIYVVHIVSKGRSRALPATVGIIVILLASGIAIGENLMLL